MANAINFIVVTAAKYDDGKGGSDKEAATMDTRRRQRTPKSHTTKDTQESEFSYKLSQRQRYTQVPALLVGEPQQVGWAHGPATPAIRC